MAAAQYEWFVHHCGVLELQAVLNKYEEEGAEIYQILQPEGSMVVVVARRHFAGW